MHGERGGRKTAQLAMGGVRAAARRGARARACLVVAIFCASPVAARPRCGRLNPSDVQSFDSLCVHLVHNHSHLSRLTLLNQSSSNTVTTMVPVTVDYGSDGWWAVRDGVKWAALAEDDDGSVGSKLVHDFHHTVWYRANCSDDAQATHAAGCTPGGYYDLGIRVSLRTVSVPRLSGASPLEAEHTVSLVSSRSFSALAAPHSTARWEPCTLLATVVLHVDPPSASEAKRTVLPGAREPPTWCYGAVEQSTAAERASTGGTHSVDLSTKPTACYQLAEANATNSVHIRYFLQQQHEERRLLDGAESGLCSDSPDERAYQRRLAELLRPLRMATRLHVHRLRRGAPRSVPLVERVRLNAAWTAGPHSCPHAWLDSTQPGARTTDPRSSDVVLSVGHRA